MGVPILRRALLAGLFAPGIALAQRNPAPAPVLWLPAFDEAHTAMLRALVTSAGFQATLGGAVPSPPANDGRLRYGADLDQAWRVLRDYLGMAAPHWNDAQRQAFTFAHSWDGYFDPPDPDYRPYLYRGDTADQITLWLKQTVMMDRAAHDDLTLPSGQVRSRQLWIIRAQVIAGIADTPAILALDEAGRRRFGLWARLNYSDMNGVMPSTDVLHQPAARVQAAALRFAQRGVETGRFLRRIGLDPDRLRLRPDGIWSVT